MEHLLQRYSSKMGGKQYNAVQLSNQSRQVDNRLTTPEYHQRNAGPLQLQRHV